MTDPLIKTATLCEYAQEKSPLTKATGSFHSVFFICFKLSANNDKQLVCIVLFVSHYLTKMLMRSSFGTLCCELCSVWI